ncbi:MAG: T9SS type A sorting domain-containing protein, partial [bacterium]
YLIKTDSLGDTLWTKTYGSADFEGGTSICRSEDGGYIITGTTAPFFEPEDMCLIKVDSLGGIIWTKIYGGTGYDVPICITPIGGNGYIIVGYTSSTGMGDADVYLLKIDPTGQVLWSKTYGGVHADIGYSVRQTSDGGYIITGSTTSYSNSTDVYLLKTDSLGNITGLQERKYTIDTHNFQVVQISPNPFSTVTSIQYYIPEKTAIKINIYNILGQIMKSVTREETPGLHYFIWDGRCDMEKMIPDGVYFCEIQIGTRFKEVKKLIKLSKGG